MDYRVSEGTLGIDLGIKSGYKICWVCQFRQPGHGDRIPDGLSLSLSQDFVREECVSTVVRSLHLKSLHPRLSFESIASQDITNSRHPVNK